MLKFFVIIPAAVIISILIIVASNIYVEKMVNKIENK
jgi:hypothetical protein